MKFKLKYKEKIYIVEDNLEKGEEIPYIWDEGNYACDCNRSLFIQRQCDENFPKFICGDKIKLIEVIK